MTSPIRNACEELLNWADEHKHRADRILKMEYVTHLHAGFAQTSLQTADVMRAIALMGAAIEKQLKESQK